VTVSPDGRALVFTEEREGRRSLWLRSLDAIEARELPGTDSGVTFTFAGSGSPGSPTSTAYPGRARARLARALRSFVDSGDRWQLWTSAHHLLLTAALTGGMLLPWLTGQVGEAHGLRPALFVVAAQFLVIAALAALARHSARGSGGGPSGM